MVDSTNMISDLPEPLDPFPDTAAAIKMAGPVNPVFGTVELLESILHKLPTKDLLFAQKVCKDWKKTIEDSPKLQRALFFRAVDIGALTFEAPDPNSPGGYVDHAGQARIVFANPLLEEVKFAVCPHTNYCPRPVRRLKKPYYYPEASWKGMLLTQPAIVVDWVFNENTFMDDTMEWRTFNTNAQRCGTMLSEVDAVVRDLELSDPWGYGAYTFFVHEWSDVLNNNEQLENHGTYLDGQWYEEGDEKSEEDSATDTDEVADG